MSELTLTLIKLGFLALLWMFVLAVLSVIRSDLFGAKVDSRAVAAPVAQNNGRTPKPVKPTKKRKGQPGSVTIADGPQALGTHACSSPRASGGSRTSAPPTGPTWTVSG